MGFKRGVSEGKNGGLLAHLLSLRLSFETRNTLSHATLLLHRVDHVTNHVSVSVYIYIYLIIYLFIYLHLHIYTM